MTNREQWLVRHAEEERMDDEHPYSRRFLMICRGIAEQIKTDQSYEPPTYEAVMAEAPWGP